MPRPVPRAWILRQRWRRIRIGYGLLLAGGFAALIWFAGAIISGYAGLARAVTGGEPWGMAIAGWLLVFAPFGVVLALAMMGSERLETKPAWALGVLLAALVPLAVYATPYPERLDLAHLVGGPGGAGFIAGLRNGALAGVVSLLVAGDIGRDGDDGDSDARAERRMSFLIGLGTFALATLAAATVLAG
ncbi:hypothetical protein AB0M02_08335 [Actinoplanes sp. NPDC051861]|uniref:hypothetical protein n=1 Tax=Actinoplanes sp. NPDC051861 TaxID=3155170 RepID=UPI0034295D28